MSYIHQALKKAQKERESNNKTLKGLITARGGKSKLLSSSALLWVLISFLVIFLAFVFFSWLDSKTLKKFATTENKSEKFVDVRPPKSVMDTAECFDRARRLHKQGHLQDAGKLYLKILKVDPGHVDALNNLGVLYLHEKNFLEASNFFKKAIRSMPGHADSYYNLACVYGLQGEVSQSLFYLRKAVSIEPSARVWALNDTDLKNLWGLPQFEEIAGK